MQEPLDEYLLSVDDGPPRPALRSAWQPHGYNDPSRSVDRRQFRWSDRQFQAKPLSAAIIYELHIGTFTSAGTFEAAIHARDPRMVGTVRLIEQRLTHDGFVERYRNEVDGLPAGEGAFLLCSFWLADNYALAGRRREARELFEKLLALRNDVGLLSEEYSPTLQRMLGNFPQAFSHIGLVNTARNLASHGGPAEDRGSE